MKYCLTVNLFRDAYICLSLPTITFAASANCIRYQGGRVVFADVEAGTLNISPKRVREAITAATKAVICVDYAGQPADIHELAAICHEYGLVLIEDAAHARPSTLESILAMSRPSAPHL